jgi:hypothetical protein
VLISISDDEPSRDLLTSGERFVFFYEVAPARASGGKIAVILAFVEK